MKWMCSTLILLSIPLKIHAFDERAKKLVIVGDSITEGYGVSQDQAYPALVQKKIDQAKQNWRVINSGVSGSTSASAESRINWLLKQKPDLLILALGANDGLRGTSAKAMEDNLAKGLAAAKKAGVKTILVGMKVPPNMGSAYAQEFEAVFPRLAKKYDVPLIPFLLDKVAGDVKLNQADAIHPNENGHVIVAETIYQFIRKKL